MTERAMSAVPPARPPVIQPGCALCSQDGGTVVWRNERLRVIRADEPGFPAFYRVVWASHLPELSDLSTFERLHCLEVVTTVERTLRQQLQPTKINLAALGNMVPHLHWHVIARFDWDSHFPAPVWATAQRERALAQEEAVRARLPEVEAVLRIQLPLC